MSKITGEKSGMDSWVNMTGESSSDHTIAPYTPLILSAVGAVGVAPFAVMRWMSADFLIAVIDTVIVCGFIGLGTYIYRTRKVRFASLLIAILCVVGTLLTIQIRGAQQAYWAYPALMACFYLVKPREAIALTLAMTALMVVQLVNAVDLLHLGTTVITALVTMVFAFAFAVINNRQQEQLKLLATRDPLTGTGNRRAFVRRLDEVISVFERTASRSALVLIDVDHFKQVNDVHGHNIGDAALREIADRIGGRIRRTDSLYRIGGEEFVVVLEGQSLATASRLAEELRQKIEGSEIAPGVRVTASFGVAEIRGQESLETWLHRADEALYEAKRKGRNIVILAD